jgi:hypothetical protein
MSSLYGAYSDVGTDYKNAKQDFRTKIDALEPFSAINQIICFTQHLRPELMVNKGVYSALINDKTCSTQMSTDQKSKDDYILAEVKRASDTSSQIMNIWFSNNIEMPDQSTITFDIKARMEVEEEPSDANPLGKFNITWQTIESEKVITEGEIKTIKNDDGKVGYTYISKNNQDNEANIDSSYIVKSLDSKKGTVFTKYNGYKNTPKTYALVWDEDTAGNFVLSKKHDGLVDSITDFSGDAKICEDRSNSDRTVWSYGVYKKDDGSSFTVNTGFPFEATKDGKTIDGYLGHWGIWIQGNESLENINNIQKINYANNTKTHITISKVGDNYIAKKDDGSEIQLEQPVTLTGDAGTYQYGGGGSLWNANPNPTNGLVPDLTDGETFSYNNTDYVVKALQGEDKLRPASVDSCSGLTLEDSASLPTSITTGFNEDSVPTRPEKVSFVDGIPQN